MGLWVLLDLLFIGDFRFAAVFGVGSWGCNLIVSIVVVLVPQGDCAVT